jgi:type III pantothenate kinase
MKALFDSGSSRLHIGYWNDERIIEVNHCTYPKHVEDIAQLIENRLAGFNVKEAVACSVSDFWREPLFSTIAALLPGKLRVARTAAEIGVRVQYERPETYGIDRAFGVFAAYRRFKKSCIVIDAGTALTVDAVAFDGSVAGGYILPGFTTQSVALSASTDLPIVKQNILSGELGTSTCDSIRLGIGFGMRAAAVQLAERARRVVDADNRIILCGSDAQMLAPAFDQPVEVVEHLVLEGLALASNILKPFS